MKSAFITLTVLLALALPLKAEVIDRIVVVVNGRIVTLSDFREREEPVAKQISVKLSGQEREKRLAELKEKVMNSLIEDSLLEQEAEKAGVTASEREIDEAIQDVMKKNNLDEEGLKSALKREGLTYDGYRIQIRREIEKSRIISQQVRSKVNVTEKDLRDNYELKQRLYLKDEEVKISHILFAVPEKASDEDVENIRKYASEVLAFVREGRPFPELARKYSQDATGKDGGALGYFKRGQVLPEFEKVIFSLKAGETSGLIRTQFGFHIVRVDEVKETAAESFEAVKDDIKSALTSEMMERRYREWMEELKKSAIIEMKM